MSRARRRHAPVLILLLGALLGACAAAGPQVKVLGVADIQKRAPSARTLVLFLEVVNPTGQELRLSRLEYRIDASSWFAASGRMRLSRPIGADATGVIEVPLELAGDVAADLDASDEVAYSLKGRLFAVADRVERSWNIEARGVIASDALAGARRSYRARLADGGE